ncbi:Phosphoglycerol transferase MdoB [Streptomyces sp. WMMB 714]|uniref:sulfatase n=1 Tax=Streptomyces sp. WMMB 714 TaxID=1286822 RepID=UPI000695D644|nr:sulfatase [Streptomyces sp. WMMB 714]SCK43551.1 Phosphoglycerol transferase MdoB [Streptomyces sp. WMMB 714]
MPLFTSSRRLQKKDEATPEGGLTDSSESARTETAVDEEAGTETAGTRAAADEGADKGAAGGAAATGAAAAGGESSGGVRGWRAKYPTAARWTKHGTSVLAALLVFAALVLPNEMDRLTLGAFLRIPGEAIFGVALLLVLPPRARRAAATAMGAALGLLTVLKFFDMGFYEFLDRPFDLVLDWVLFDDAESFLEDSVGKAGAIAAVIGVVVLIIALLVLNALAVRRLGPIVLRDSRLATRTTLALGTAWFTLAALQIPGIDVPVASKITAGLVNNRIEQVGDGLKDERIFAKEAAHDKFENTPPDELLTGLRGKDVIFAFVESYGRDAIENPEMSAGVNAGLAEGQASLEGAGFSSRSGWLTSPVTGSGSWMAHATFMSGLWIDNQQRYRTLTSSDRLTLTRAFRRTDDWRTAGMMPGVTKAWPEGKFYGLDHVYDSREMGYKGPKFSWSPVPDQYTMKAYERLESGKKNRKPLMSEIILATSHNPWAPLPKMVDWDELGDGSVYHRIKKAGKDPKDVWRDERQVRQEYARSVRYSMKTLTSYLEKYGHDDTVLVVLGDHQPVPTVVGNHASRDVPVSVIAKDDEVMDRIDDWNWKDGLRPDKETPVWRMDKFRDRFMTAYGPDGDKPGKDVSGKGGSEDGKSGKDEADEGRSGDGKKD